MLTLYQAEWCPYCHKVRQRLTELEVDYLIKQVPPDRADRTELAKAVGSLSIPAVVWEDGSTLSGSDEIIAALNERFSNSKAIDEHRENLRKTHAVVRRVGRRTTAVVKAGILQLTKRKRKRPPCVK